MSESRPCKCGRGEQREGQRTCALCHREYMLDWRTRRAALLAQPITDGEFSGVYFVQSGDFVKIGLSYDVRSRLRGLICSTPYEVTPLAFIPGHVSELAAIEAQLHAQFKNIWHRGEWF